MEKWLPKPIDNLTNEELVDLYQREQDELKINAILDLMIDRIGGFINSFCRNYENIPHLNFEDLRSILLIELLSVLENFKINKGIKLTTVCRSYFTQRLNREYRDQTTQKRYDPQRPVYSLEGTLDFHGEDKIGIGKIGALNFTAICEEYEQVDLIDLLCRLDLTKNEILTCLMITQGESKSEIARRLKVSPTTINNYLKNVKKKWCIKAV